MTNTRVAFGLVCILVVCCSVMYITSDAEDVLAHGETVHASWNKADRRAGFQNRKKSEPKSVSDMDIQKATTVFTDTPKGSMKLNTYLHHVDAEIAAEEAARKRDVFAVRAQMDRNEAFNERAREELKKHLLLRMKKNEKKTKVDLYRAMRWTQFKFHRAAALSNTRQKMNAERSKKIRLKIDRDRRYAAAQLRNQVAAQQRAMAALSSATNRRITRTNKSIAVNAAQIKHNAAAAQKALEKAVAMFDKKAANARNLAAAGRSKLAAQLVAQKKATRQWANNKLKVVIAKTAAQFRRVRAKMQRDRHHADFALKAATSRMTASLNAFKALNDKRFSKNIKRINYARREAKRRVARAKAEFKIRIRSLRTTVHMQVAKTNTRISQLSGIVDKDKLAQAKINQNVAAEMKRMIKIGNQRYAKHLKKDAELRRLVNSNKAVNAARLRSMADHYNNQLDRIRATMKKNRAHATRMLAKKTSALYTAIAKSEKAQMKENRRLAKLTRDARLDIMDNLRSAKHDFTKRMGTLHATIARNDRKFSKKMDKLTGIVRANAIKSAKGRANIAALMKANRQEMQAAVATAVRKGESRMMQVENRLKNMNKKTKQSLNMRITARISKYAKFAARQIEGLRLSSKRARAEMRKELLYAVRSASKEAKKDLAAAYKSSTRMFNYANRRENAAARMNAAARAKLARSIAVQRKRAQRQLDDAVGTMSRSLSALKFETRKKLSKANRSVTAYANQLAKEQKKVNALMKVQMGRLVGGIIGMSGRISSKTGAANAKSAAGFANVAKQVKYALAVADKKSKRRFAKLFAKMSAQRIAQNRKLKAETVTINDKIAKQAALEDSRFKKTVKNINAARKEATAQVKAARKSFATRIQTATAAIKDQESRLLGEVKVVGEELISHKATQLRVNRRTFAEMKRIRIIANHRYSVSKRARGKLRQLLDENKKAAAQEVKALDRLFSRKLASIRSKATSDARAAGRDLRTATRKLYYKLSRAQLEASMANQRNAKAIKKYSLKSQQAIRTVKKSFSARLNTLTNTVIANNRAARRGLEVLTGVIRKNKANGRRDRALIRSQNKALGLDFQAKIDRYVQEGEAKAKRVAHRARRNLAAAQKSMLLEISARVEATADNVFKSIQGNHKTIADNYLSLKAYAVSSKKKLKSYVGSGRGMNLSSLGETLVAIAGLSSIKAPKAVGLGSGSSSIPSPFSSKNIKVPRAATAINGIVNEYTTVLGRVRSHWPLGLGKYLLMKFEEAMMAKGVLQVDRVRNKSGNFVFMNGRTVGLSNKLNDFESLAVPMVKYEAVLAKLTSMLAGKATVYNKNHPAYVKAPAWPGD